MKGFKKIFSIYYKMTKGHHGTAIATLAAYGSASFNQKVLMPIFVTGIFAAMTKHDSVTVFRNFWILLWMFLLSNILYRLGDWLITVYENNALMLLQQQSFEAIITQPQHFFANTHSGALIARMNRFTTSFETMFDSLAYTFMFSIIQVIGIAVVLALKSPLMGGIVSIWAVLYVITSTYMARLRNPIDAKQAEASSDLTAASADVITNAVTVLLHGMRKQEMLNFQKVNEYHGKWLSKSWNYSTLQNAIQGVLTSGLEIGAFGFGLWLWASHRMSAPDVALVYLYMGIIATTMWEVGRTYVRFTKAITNAEEMVEILESVPEVILSEEADEYRLVNGAIMIKNLTFSYSTGRNVIDNMHLTIKNGEHIGIVGSSGAGKTTLVSLLMKMRDPIGGIIEIGGKDIAEIEHESLRRQIAIVPQDVTLMHNSILYNISYGKPDATLEEVMLAAKKADIHDTIMNFPKGYDTIVGERGIKLSGGQRQRVAVARALIVDAKIIILDEATSALDALTEGNIQHVLQNGLKDKTVIIITHRLATIRHCDRVIVLENGSVKEDGPHSVLMEKDGLYSELVRRQFAH